MGQVIRFENHLNRTARAVQSETECLIPVDFGVGVGDLRRSLALIARYGNGAVQVRPVGISPDEFVYLMAVTDAIYLNKQLLEHAELSEAEIAVRIDLIQTLENINTPLLESIWSAFSGRSGLPH